MSEARILYIEDDPGNRMLVRRILEAEGFSVTEAADGPGGLEICLLYTSPSPRDRTRSRMPSSA